MQKLIGLNLLRYWQVIVVWVPPMEVPGHDGKKGFGALVLQKILQLYLNILRKLANISAFLLLYKLNINNSIRSNYHNLDPRERDQNVNYEIDK